MAMLSKLGGEPVHDAARIEMTRAIAEHVAAVANGSLGEARLVKQLWPAFRRPASGKPSEGTR